MINLRDLQSGAKQLNSVPESKCSKSSGTGGSFSQADLEPLEALYERHGGDLDKIFAELRADPTKAKKPHHRPRDKHEFAEKYLQGFYSQISDATADAKSHK